MGFIFRLSFLVFVSAVVLPVLSYAQKGGGGPKTPGELMELGSAAFRVPKTSKFYGELFGVKSPKGASLPRQEHRGIGKGAPALKILRHYRGPEDQSILMPTPDQARHPLESKKGALAGLGKRLRAAFERYEKKVQNPEFLPFSGEVIPACFDHKTERKKFPRDQNLLKKLNGGKPVEMDEKEKVHIDILFVGESDYPMSPQEVFGKKVVVRKLTEEESEKSSSMRKMAQSLGATCLPYRVRITRDNLFKHYGNEALKNFDSNPDGKGKYHDLIKPKVDAHKKILKGKKK